MQITPDIPLLPFLLRWRAYERSFGRLTSDPETLLLMLGQLAKGYNLQNKEDLYSLCKILLLKPRHEEAAFRQLFEEYLLEIVEIARRKAEQESKDKNLESDSDRPGITDSLVEEPESSSDPQAPKEAKEQSPISSTETTSLPSSEETISLFFANADAVVEGISVETEKQGMDEIIFQKAFIIKGDDYLLPGRVLKQAWRSMRNLQEIGRQNILDVDQTVQAVAEKGFLDRPVFKAAYQNTTQLTLLLDASSSMVAFSDLGQKIIETAKQDRHFQHLRVFYFDNLPEDYLFYDEQMTEPIDIRDFLNLPKTPVLIFSDAGAARGLLNWDRVKQTIAFLDLLAAPKWTWINPMPRTRWLDTTAELIADHSQHMFECNSLEFRNAIKMLRGKW
ncbi:MAG: hypothetical protein Sapg2KO_36000 [Saprospiraceae bacterium]